MKYMKSLGFLLVKCYQATDDPRTIVAIKPYEIIFYQNYKVVSSIATKRIRNVYFEKNKIVL
jgi:hypothetical protein